MAELPQGQRNGVRVDLKIAWSLQQRVKLAGPNALPGLAEFRARLNSAIIDMSEGASKEAVIPVTREEAWLLDSVVNAESSDWAKPFLLQLFKAIWEYEYGLPLGNEKDKPYEDVRGLQSEGGEEAGKGVG